MHSVRLYIPFNLSVLFPSIFKQKSGIATWQVVDALNFEL